MNARRAGYTLVEMLMVIAIIGVLTTIVFVNFTGLRSEEELESASKVMAAEVRQVTTWSQTGKLEETTGLLPEGYGIVVQPGTDQYSLYAEFDGDFSYQATGSDLLIETVTLSGDELIDTVEFSSCTPTSPYCDLFTRIYSGEVYTAGSQVDDFEIVLEHTVSGDQLTVMVDRVSGAVNAN